MGKACLGLILGLCLLSTASLLAFPSITSTVQRELDKHLGSDAARFEAIERAAEVETVRRRDDDWRVQQTVAQHEREISKNSSRLDSLEKRADKFEERMFAMFLAFTGALLTGLVGLGVNLLLTYRTHQTVRRHNAWDGSERRRAEDA